MTLPGGVVVTVLTGPGPVVAKLRADGTPDPAFGGGDGRAEVDRAPMGGRSGTGTAVAVDAAGRIVVGLRWYDGDADRGAVVRLRSDGAMDPGFDGDGFTSVVFGRDLDSAVEGVAVTPRAAWSLWVTRPS